MTAEELQKSFLLLVLFAGCDELFGFGEILRSQFALHFYQTLDQRLVLLEKLVVSLGHRTGYNQRCTCIVNQDGVYLVDDGVVVLPLYEVARRHGHIVAQIVEAELIVRSEGDISLVSTATGF